MFTNWLAYSHLWCFIILKSILSPILYKKYKLLSYYAYISQKLQKYNLQYGSKGQDHNKIKLIRLVEKNHTTYFIALYCLQYYHSYLYNLVVCNITIVTWKHGKKWIF